MEERTHARREEKLEREEKNDHFQRIRSPYSRAEVYLSYEPISPINVISEEKISHGKCSMSVFSRESIEDSEQVSNLEKKNVERREWTNLSMDVSNNNNRSSDFEKS